MWRREGWGDEVWDMEHMEDGQGLKSGEGKKKKRVISCQANWVIFLMELVTEQN